MARLTESAQAAEPVLEARQITKLYGGLRAVDDVSFAVRPNEILGIAGPNGAGKTTLFDTITGHTVATSGEIVLRGESVVEAKIHQRCRLGLARTFQHPVAAETLTALENTYLAASFRQGVKRRRSRAGDIAAGREALAVVGLEQYASTQASLLPVAARKRLMIATALATDPHVLLLDEPFGGLGVHDVDDTVSLIKRIRDTGMAIVCIEHVMRALVALADRVLVMHHGAELFVGTPEAMMADERVIDVYLGARGGGAA